MTSPKTIAQEVEVLHQGFAGQVPDELLSTFFAEQKILDAAGVPEAAAKAGSAMPDGDLLDAHGQPTTLTAARAGKPAVVVFYRGAWCPYCNVALRNYQANLVPELDSRGIALIAVSPQKADGSLSMAEKNDLTFTVLSDPGNQIASALGILTAPTEDVRGALHATGVDLPALNSDGTYTLPMVTVAVVDAAGVIRWIDVAPNHAKPAEVADIISALDKALS
ncbi:MAG TPA: peroxiredoxin-like family protein [Streptosporangiaceae bacterium]